MARRVGLCVAGIVVAIVSTAWAGATGDDEIAVLIRQLGDADYGRRERAAARLDEIGAAAIDQLLTAAEVHDDLEVSLRAGWLADSIPMTTSGDASEAAALLDGYKSKSLGDRIRIMHQLLRLDDDTGIVPLARIGRLDRDPVAARVAAALLVREWSPGDPSWPALGERIMAGIGGSSRPVARLLASVVAFSGTDSSTDRGRSLEAAREMVAVLDRGRPAEADVAGDDLETTAAPAAIKRDIGRTTQQIFDRCLAMMLTEAGRREEAVAVVRKEMDAAIRRKGDAVAIVAGVADALIWAAAHGLPEVVDGLPADRTEGPLAHQVIAYARAICERARQQDAVAERIARAAFETEGATFTDRRQTGGLLVKWGAGDWAAREFTAVVDDGEAAPAERVGTSILYSEFLHDRGRDDEAAGLLQRVVEDAEAGRHVEILHQFGRDPASTRARMHFFRALAAEARGDAAGCQKELEAATAGDAADVDALIALHRRTADRPQERRAVVQQIEAVLGRMEQVIKDVPDEPNSYNEYAWLVANTEGDVPKAVRYSRRSLRDSFDNASYLDTLAHCHAAAGDLDRAIRTQRLALRHEPHNRIIRLNLEAFERRAAASRQ
jgi:tetratricopeptide (TPR) repeat protein